VVGNIAAIVQLQNGMVSTDGGVGPIGRKKTGGKKIKKKGKGSFMPTMKTLT